MKQLFTLFFLACMTAAGIYAQQACTPDAQYTQPGVYPDSATNFAPAYANSPYSQLVTIVVPQDTQAFPPPIPPITWDSTVMTSMTGLPPGFTYACWNVGPGNQSRCSWRGNTSGCAIITGNPTIADTGTYPLTINTDNYVGGSTSPIAYTITYYRIVVNAPSSTGDPGKITFEVLQNHPNPFHDKSEISFYSEQSGFVDVKVYNMVGSVVSTLRVKAKSGLNKILIDSKNFTSGIYMYSVSNGEKTVTKRMVINR